MSNEKESFIEFALHYKVLQFGDFKLKSGRQSPYFFNVGLFHDGLSLSLLGKAYSRAYIDNQLSTPHLFGPAYKGISLAVATSIALAEAHVQTTVTFNRKEPKTHGEQGELIGASLQGDVTIIDDVITAGTAFREACNYIKSHGGKVHSLMIALDRCERGQGKTSALDEIRESGVKVISLITLFDIIAYLHKRGETHQASLIEAYQKQYAPSSN